MYIYHKDFRYLAFTSLKALSNTTGIPYDTLTYQFSRNGVKRYQRDGATIVKVTPITSKRKP